MFGVEPITLECPVRSAWADVQVCRGKSTIATLAMSNFWRGFFILIRFIFMLCVWWLVNVLS